MRDELIERLNALPRRRFAHLPTPLEPLERLGAELGGAKLWIKRDDCTGLATGGNKTRKLEYLMGAALAEGADTLITQGAVQSNHARQTAAIAARLGMRCHLLFERRVPTEEDDYAHNGNVLLDRLLGAQLSEHRAGTDMNAAMQEVAQSLRAEGLRPYVVPGGGSNPVGAAGYAHAAVELLEQANGIGLRIDHLVHATGSSGTQAGLVAGLHACESEVPVLGIGVRAPREQQERMVHDLACRTLAHLGFDAALPREKVVANSDYVGEGYGLPTEAMIEAVTLLARAEGVLLDPVYTGKGMAGLIDLVRRGEFEKGANVVFLHTGGAVGLFGYRWAFPELAGGE